MSTIPSSVYANNFPFTSTLPLADKIIDPTYSKVKKLAILLFATLSIIPLAATLITLTLDGLYHVITWLRPTPPPSPPSNQRQDEASSHSPPPNGAAAINAPQAAQSAAPPPDAASNQDRLSAQRGIREQGIAAEQKEEESLPASESSMAPPTALEDPTVATISTLMSELIEAEDGSQSASAPQQLALVTESGRNRFPLYNDLFSYLSKFLSAEQLTKLAVVSSECRTQTAKARAIIAELDLSGSLINDAQLIALLDQYTELKSLNLSSCPNITGVGIRAVANKAKNDKFTHIDVSHNQDNPHIKIEDWIYFLKRLGNNLLTLNFSFSDLLERKILQLKREVTALDLEIFQIEGTPQEEWTPMTQENLRLKNQKREQYQREITQLLQEEEKGGNLNERVLKMKQLMQAVPFSKLVELVLYNEQLLRLFTVNSKSILSQLANNKVLTKLTLANIEEETIVQIIQSLNSSIQEEIHLSLSNDPVSCEKMKSFVVSKIPLWRSVKSIKIGGLNFSISNYRQSWVEMDPPQDPLPNFILYDRLIRDPTTSLSQVFLFLRERIPEEKLSTEEFLIFFYAFYEENNDSNGEREALNKGWTEFCELLGISDDWD